MLSEFVVVVPERFGWEFGGLATPNGAAGFRVRPDLHWIAPFFSLSLSNG